MTGQEFLTVAGWIAEERCEFNCDGEWVKATMAGLAGTFSNYRRKTQPKFRPWKPEEVPVGALLIKHGYLPQLIIGCDSIGVKTVWGFGLKEHQDGKTCYGILANQEHQYKHSTDGGKNWLPCGVLESE